MLSIMKKDKETFSSKKILITANIISVIVIFFLVFFILKVSTKNNYNRNIIIHDNSSSYKFTNPILDCEFDNQDQNTIIFSGNVIKKVEQIKDKYSLDFISLYYRDLNNGPWVGVNEKETFAPASLSKVPLLMEFLHETESNPSLLNKEVEIIPSSINQEIHQNITFDGVLEVGKKYTLNEIVESMIEKSDNTAVTALIQNINLNALGEVFKAVGVPFKDATTEMSVRVKDFAGFFRVLFNASYLSREMSEKALDILSKTEYKDGLVAGVPSGVVVSHKFGERNIAGSEDSNQLHDCGIIYYPNKPYILCVMTRGNNQTNQGKSIKELSNYIYNEVDKNSK